MNAFDVRGLCDPPQEKSPPPVRGPLAGRRLCEVEVVHHQRAGRQVPGRAGPGRAQWRPHRRDLILVPVDPGAPLIQHLHAAHLPC
jgi:hypothetical protein